MHRFFLPASTKLIKNEYFITDKNLIHQLLKVLRVQVNQSIILIKPNNPIDFVVQIKSIHKKQIICTNISEIKNTKEPKNKLHLYFGLLKNPTKNEMILQKCTEIGVHSFTPLITERTQTKQLNKLDRLEKIIQEAAEQSGRFSIPIINQPTELKNLLNNKQINYIATPVNPLKKSPPSATHKEFNLFIGPEGGFTKEELTTCLKANFIPITLNQLILRAETASIIATYTLLAKEN